MGNRTVLARIRRLGEQAVDRFEYAVFSGRLKMVDGFTGQNLPQKPIGIGARAALHGLTADATGATRATTKSRGANASNYFTSNAGRAMTIARTALATVFLGWSAFAFCPTAATQARSDAPAMGLPSRSAAAPATVEFRTEAEAKAH